MSTLTYSNIALDWRLPGQSDSRFRNLSLALLVIVLGTAGVFSSIPVPEPQYRERAVVPDRVARFVAQRPVPPEPVVEPPPRVAPPPPPPPETTPRVQRERPQERDNRALSETQRSARERAQSTGLLALHNELASLMDTGELTTMVAGSSNQSGDTDVEQTRHDLSAITGRAAQAGTGVNASRYGSQVSGTSLDERDIADVRSGLFAVNDTAESGVAADDTVERGDGLAQARSREDVTITFDQNKGALYALYARERRRSPHLEGRIVLRITIAPSGEVTDVHIVSSELNSPSLESGIIGRIKMFRFEAMDVDEITVTYPIEFLPT